MNFDTLLVHSYTLRKSIIKNKESQSRIKDRNRKSIIIIKNRRYRERNVEILKTS